MGIQLGVSKSILSPTSPGSVESHKFRYSTFLRLTKQSLWNADFLLQTLHNRLCCNYCNNFIFWVRTQVSPFNYMGFPGGSDGKESSRKAGDQGLIPGSRRSPRKGNGYPLQHSCLENSMDRGAWQATVHGVTKSRTQLSANTFTFFTFMEIETEVNARQQKGKLGVSQ